MKNLKIVFALIAFTTFCTVGAFAQNDNKQKVSETKIDVTVRLRSQIETEISLIIYMIFCENSICISKSILNVTDL